MASKFQELIKKKKDPITETLNRRQSIAQGQIGGGVFRGDGYTIENGVRFEDDPKPNVALTNERGRTTGVIKDSRTLLGLSKEDVQKLAPQGTVTAEEIAAQERVLQATQNIGQIEEPTGIEVGTDKSQAATAGFAKDPAGIARDAAIGTWAGAKVGAAIGTAVAPGVGTGVGGAIGAGVGAVGGAGVAIWRNVQSDIESQQKGQIQANVVQYNQGIRNLRTLALLARTYPEQSEQLIEDFNTQKYLMHQARANIKLETDEDIEKYIEDGTVILAKFDTALGEDGIVNIYETRLNLAITQDIPMNDDALLQALDDAIIE